MTKEELIQRIEKEETINEILFEKEKEEYITYYDISKSDTIESLVSRAAIDPMQTTLLCFRLKHLEESYPFLQEEAKRIYNFFQIIYEIICFEMPDKDVGRSYTIFIETLSYLLEIVKKHDKFLNMSLYKNKIEVEENEAPSEKEMPSIKLSKTIIENYYDGDIESFFHVLSSACEIGMHGLWLIATAIILKKRDPKQKKRFMLRTKCPIDTEEQLLKDLDSYASFLFKQYHQFAYHYENQKKRLHILKKAAYNFKENQYIDFTNVLESQIGEDDISLVFLAYIFLHNLNLDSILEEKYKTLKQNSYSAFLSLLHKYHYQMDFHKEEIEKLLAEKKVRELEDNLSFLKSQNYIQDKNFIYYLTLDKESLSFLEDCICKEYFQFSYLEKHIVSIYQNISSFKENIKLLSLEVPISRIKNSSLFLLPTEFLSYMISCSKFYKIDLKNVSLQFLSHPSAFQNLDRWIELGEKDFIYSHTQYLKYDLLPIQLKLASVLKIDYEKDKKLEKNMTSILGNVGEEDLYKALMIPREKESVMGTYKPYTDLLEIEERLKPYACDDVTYYYEGFYLSKYRILRILSSLDTPLTIEDEKRNVCKALVTGTLYTNEERNIIENLSSMLCFSDTKEKVKK